MKNKQIIFNVELASPTKVKQGIPPTVFTNDTNTVEFIFNVTDLEVPETATAEVNIFMRDGSFFQKDALVEGSEIRYTLSDTEGKHAGLAQIQMTLSYENKRYSTNIFQFKIDSGLNDKVAVEVLIQDWDSITTEARQYLEQLADDRTEFSEIIADAQAQVDANVVEGAVENKFNALEAEYAQDITSLKQSDISLTAQLQHKADKSQIGAPLSVSDISDMTDETRVYVNTTDGNWYSWNGSEWVSGGTYNSQGVGDGTITYKKIHNTTTATNKLDPNDPYAPNKAVAATTGVMHDNVSYDVYRFEVKPNTNYALTGLRNAPGVYKDSADVFISRVGSDATSGPESRVITTPDNAKYLYLNIFKEFKGLAMVVEGDKIPSEYIPFRYIITDIEIGLNNLSPDIKNDFNTMKNDISVLKNTHQEDKEVVAFGDSITWQDGRPYGSNHLESGSVAVGYINYLRTELGMNVNNQGVSGESMRQIQRRIEIFPFESGQTVTITAGANDWTLEYAIGDLLLPKSTFNTNTFYGALQQAVEHILNLNLDIKIVLITPIRGYHPTATHNGEWLTNSKVVNGMIEQPDFYAKAFKDVANLYGLEVIDLRDGIGLNFINYMDLLRDNTTFTNGKFVHPGNKLHGIMGRYVVERFKNIPL